MMRKGALTLFFGETVIAQERRIANYDIHFTPNNAPLLIIEGEKVADCDYVLGGNTTFGKAGARLCRLRVVQFDGMKLSADGRWRCP